MTFQSKYEPNINCIHAGSFFMLFLLSAFFFILFKNFQEQYQCQSVWITFFVCFAALRPKVSKGAKISYGYLMAGLSVDLTTLFPGQA